jgi:hypothetical protein
MRLLFYRRRLVGALQTITGSILPFAARLWLAAAFAVAWLVVIAGLGATILLACFTFSALCDAILFLLTGSGALAAALVCVAASALTLALYGLRCGGAR